MAKGKLRVGVVGTGFAGGTHAARLAKIAGVEVAAICDVQLENARKLAAEVAPAAKCFGDFDKMLRFCRLDAAYICLPPFAHRGQVEAAAAKGLHLFLEKPLALTISRARSMVRAIEKAGVVGQVGYHMRFGHAVAALKRMIDGGKAGLPTLFAGRYFCNAIGKQWWCDAKRGGGQIFEQIIHIYDMAMHLLGKPVAVSTFAGNLLHRKVKGYTIEDTSASIIRFESGAMASIVGSNCAVPTQWTGDFRVVCRNVTADFAEPNTAVFTFGGENPSEYYWKTGKRPVPKTVAGDIDCYLAEDRNFIDAVRGKCKPMAPVRDGLTSLLLVDAAVRSAKAGGKIIRL
ncbi:MAG: Gfo/Idh/MocA family oxidoreductase [Planctomycetes bacterium]|nr:Gfo/Idh/MocA family oxidoreductase [Planctomycetota bacterium]